jgi:hypothetical protein
MKNLWITLIVGFLMCSSLIFQLNAEDLEERENSLKELTKGEQFLNRQDQYAWLPEVFAVKSQLDVDDQTQQLLYSNYGNQLEYLESKGDFQFFRFNGITRNNLATMDADDEDQEKFPVVLNERTRQFGIISGTLIVKLQSPAEAQEIADQYQIEILDNFPHLGYVYFTLPAGENLLNLKRTIAGDGRVLNAELEVMEDLNEPQ